MMPESNSTLSALLAGLGVFVLERYPDGTLVPITESPDWFVHLLPNRSEPVTETLLGARVPFLEAFFASAQPFWNNGRAGRLRSGPWMETDSQGNDRLLEASAFCVSSKHVLVIESGDREVGSTIGVLQKAREASLTNESLTKQLLACERSKKSVAFDMSDACRGIERFVDAVNPAELAPQALQYREIGKRQIRRLQDLIRELEGPARPSSAGRVP
jgi:hypothetical protein